MHVVIEQTKLAKILEWIESFADPKGVNPIMAHILVEARGKSLLAEGPREESLVFSATNADTSIYMEVAHRGVLKAGKVTLPAQEFANTVSLLSEGKVELKRQANGRVEIRSEASKTTTQLMTLDPKEFPLLPTPAGTPYPIPAATLLQGIQMTRFCVSEEESRYTLGGVLIDFSEDGHLRAVATDGHRLSCFETDYRSPADSADNESPQILIPKRALPALTKIFGSPRLQDQTLTLSWTMDHIFATYPGLTAISSRLAGNFPKYEALIQNNGEHTLQLDAAALQRAIQLATVVQASKKHANGDAIRLSVAETELTVTAEATEVGDASSSLSVSAYAGPPVMIGFNPNYVMDFLRAQPADKIKLCFTDAKSLVLMKPSPAQPVPYRMTFVLMPLAL